MNRKMYGVLFIFSLIMNFYSCASLSDQEITIPAGTSIKDFSFTIENKVVTLINGISESIIVPGAASREITKYFGSELEIDLNKDSTKDRVLLITKEAGGSGTFYYIVGVLIIDGKYYGTKAVFIGDRISPQIIFINPDNESQIILSYGERKIADSPMNVITRKFEFKDNKLIDVL